MLRARGIGCSLPIMPSAIKFDDQLRFATGEIDDVRTDKRLPSEVRGVRWPKAMAQVSRDMVRCLCMRLSVRVNRQRDMLAEGAMDNWRFRNHFAIKARWASEPVAGS